MFKNSEDERQFTRVLQAYQAEFGCDNLIVFVPDHVGSSVNPDLARAVTVECWHWNVYAIRVRDSSAMYDLTPQEQEH